MMRLPYALAGAFALGSLFYLANAVESPAPRQPSPDAIFANYRTTGSLVAGATDGEAHVVAAEARRRAADDLDYARSQLALAHAAVEQIMSEIAIDDAAHVDIGGEIRAARTAEAEWRRVVDVIAAHVAQLDFQIARNRAPGR